MNVDGKVVVVTGGASGLGAALVDRFVAEGAVGVVAADITAGATEAERVIPMVCDVAVPEDVDRVVDGAVDRFGRLDVMVNNAGVLNPNARLHNLSLDDWRRVIDVNLLGVVNGITASVRVMRGQGGGAIISTASVAGMTAWAYSGPYGATKAAVIQLTRIAALEYAGDGIRVNCVCPGAFSSPMYAGLPAPAIDAIAERHPLGIGTTDDLVGAYIYLASDDAKWTTGTALVVDGGYIVP